MENAAHVDVNEAKLEQPPDAPSAAQTSAPLQQHVVVDGPAAAAVHARVAAVRDADSLISFPTGIEPIKAVRGTAVAEPGASPAAPNELSQEAPESRMLPEESARIIREWEEKQNKVHEIVIEKRGHDTIHYYQDEDIVNREYIYADGSKLIIVGLNNDAAPLVNYIP
jgi:hypothetical protein